jgi:hypothetical protein
MNLAEFINWAEENDPRILLENDMLIWVDPTDTGVNIMSDYTGDSLEMVYDDECTFTLNQDKSVTVISPMGVGASISHNFKRLYIEK